MSQDCESRLRAVTTLLQEMDRQQQKSDLEGDREIAWFWWRGDIEKALGYAPCELFPDLEDEL